MRRLDLLDRVAVLLLGLAMVALGLLGLDWRHGVVLDLDSTWRTGGAQDVAGADWWPWVGALAGVVLGVLGLLWLLAHARRPGPATVRLAASGPTGRLQVDVRSLARAAATDLGLRVPLQDVRGTTLADHGRVVVELRGRLDADATTSVPDLAAAAAVCAEQLALALPEGAVACRVVLDAPRRRPTRPERGRDRLRVPARPAAGPTGDPETA